MKRLTFTLFFLAQYLFVNAQDTFEITTLVNDLLSAIDQKKPSKLLTINIDSWSVNTKLPTVINENYTTIISAPLENKKGLFLLKNTSNVISGFIYREEEDQSYLISSDGESIVATKVPTYQVFCADPIPETINEHSTPATNPSSVFSLGRRIPLGNNLTASALNLQSKPGAPHLLLLDFDGEDISNWGYNFPTVYASNYTDEQIRLVWEVISADMLTFDINVTTNRKLYDDHLVSKKLICVFGEATGLNQVGGKSLVNIFGAGNGCLVNSKNGDKGVETAHIGSHEIGHAMGLMHDGTMWPGPSIPYYGGHADWTPIMGISYGKTYVTWSKGEYEFASQPEDDIAKIGAHAGFVVDGQVKAVNLVIGQGDSLNFMQNNGIIENRNDVDTFVFELSQAGLVDLLISPAVAHTNLDVEVELLDDQLQQIFHSNTILQRWETIHQVVAAGKYFLVIKSGFENTANDGFTNYSSFGYYEITGNIENLVKGEYDISIAQFNGFDQRCGDAVVGSVTVKNSGEKSVVGGTLEVYLNDVLFETIQITDEILPNSEVEISNISVTAAFNNRLKFVFVAEASYTESILENNTAELDYFIERGNLISFQTNLLSYNAKLPFSWTVTEHNSPSAILIDGKSVEAKAEGILMEQTFCLESDCYDFNISGDFNLCSMYTAYQASSIYVGGDVVAHNGNLYKAKWWTQKDPTSASDWELQGECNSDVYNVVLTDKTEGVQLFTTNSVEYSGSVEEEVCVDVLTTSTTEILGDNFKMFPNPADHMLTITSQNPIEQLSIYDINGKLVQQYFSTDKSMTVDISVLKSGMYFVRVGDGRIRKLKK